MRLISFLLLLIPLQVFAQSIEPLSLDNDPRCGAPNIPRPVQDFPVQNGVSVDYYAPWGISGGACEEEDLSPVWTISNFPSGFSIDPSSGRITGTWPTDVLVSPSITLTTTKGSITDDFIVTVGNPVTSVAGERVGVPADAWLDVADEVKPDRPADWSSQVAGYYYVDFQNGSNANGLGTPSAPRQTLPRPIPAGSYVEMANNYSYVTGGIIAIESAGTEAEPVWVTRAPGQSLSIFGAVTIAYGTHFILDDLQWNSDGPYNTFQFGSTTSGYTYYRGVLRNSLLVGHPDSTGGASSTQDAGDTSSYSLFHNNVIRDHGVENSPTDDDVTLIAATDGTLNMYVFDNTAHGTPGACMQLGTGPTVFRPVTDVFVNGNEFYGCRQSGFWAKNILRGVVSQNYVHNVNNRCVPVGDPSPSKGGGGQYFLEDYFVLLNEFRNVGYGVSIPSTNDSHGTKVTVSGNYFYDIEPQGGGCTDDVVSATNPFSGSMVHVRANSNANKDILVSHNTGVRVQGGLYVSTPSSGGLLNFYANIIDTITNPDGRHMFDSSGVAEASFNVYADGNSGNGDAIDVRSGSTDYTSLTTLQLNTSKGDDASVVDPTYVAEGSNDFRLDAASAHKTGSTDGGVQARFQAAFGFAITKDINGVNYPVGASDWSVGASQYEAP